MYCGHWKPVSYIAAIPSLLERNRIPRYKAIIDRFGRYPHRNAILGRTSSAEELAFLSEPGSSY
jgi:uncharacterized protein (DUF924 family)